MEINVSEIVAQTGNVPVYRVSVYADTVRVEEVYSDYLNLNPSGEETPGASVFREKANAILCADERLKTERVGFERIIADCEKYLKFTAVRKFWYWFWHGVKSARVELKNDLTKNKLSKLPMGTEYISFPDTVELAYLPEIGDVVYFVEINYGTLKFSRAQLNHIEFTHEYFGPQCRCEAGKYSFIVEKEDVKIHVHGVHMFHRRDYAITFARHHIEGLSESLEKQISESPAY